MSMNDDDRALKNAIFAAKQAKENASGAASVRRDLGLEIPIHAVPLPSAGKLYGPDSPLCDQETVDIKAMTAKEENILMSRALVRKGTVVTELLKSCMMDKSVDVNAMVSGDRNAVMIAIRVTGYGEHYSPRVTCPGCDNAQDFTFDLSKLEIKELDLTALTQVAPNTNLFKFTLPYCKKVVEFKFLTGREEELIYSIQEAKRKKGLNNDETVTTRLLHSLTSVDGETDRTYIAQFLNSMLARDSLALRKHIDENEPSVDMSQEFTCNSCGYQEVKAIPMDSTFLWPGTKSTGN